MMGWFTVLDVIKQVKASARQARDGYCPDWLAGFLGTAAIVFFAIVMARGFWELSH